MATAMVKLPSKATAVVLVLGLLACMTLLGLLGGQSLTPEQACARARDFADRAGIGTLEVHVVDQTVVRDRLAAYFVQGMRNGQSIVFTVRVLTGRVSQYDWFDRIAAAKKRGTSGPNRFATAQAARAFALELASSLYAGRTLTVTSFKREAGLWSLHASHDVQRHGYRFVDRSFGVALGIDAADGTLLTYNEKYAIPDVEPPPSSPIAVAQAYRVATGGSMPASSTVQTTLGYALPQGATSGTAVLCWRLRFPRTGTAGATVIDYVDAKRSTLIKRSVLK